MQNGHQRPAGATRRALRDPQPDTAYVLNTAHMLNTAHGLNTARGLNTANVLNTAHAIRGHQDSRSRRRSTLDGGGGDVVPKLSGVRARGGGGRLLRLLLRIDQLPEKVVRHDERPSVGTPQA